MTLRTAVVAGCVLSLAASAPGARGADSGSVAARVQSSPLRVTLELTPERIGPGQSARADATVSNLGTQRVRAVSLELRGDPAELRVTGRNPRRLSDLPAGTSGSAHWLVCGRGPLDYVLVAQARAKLGDAAVVAESEAELLTVTGPPACR